MRGFGVFLSAELTGCATQERTKWTTSDRPKTTWGVHATTGSHGGRVTMYRNIVLMTLGVLTGFCPGTSVTVAASSPATTEWMEGGDTLTTFHNITMVLYGNLVSGPTIIRAADGTFSVRIAGSIVPVRPNGLTRPPAVQEDRRSPHKADPQWLAGVQHLKNQAAAERNAILARSTTPATLELEKAVAAVYRASPLVERAEVKKGLVFVFLRPNASGVTSFGHMITQDPPRRQAHLGPRFDHIRYTLWQTLTRLAERGIIVVIRDGGGVAGTVPVEKLDRVMAEMDEAKWLLTGIPLDDAYKLWPDGKTLEARVAWEAANPIEF